jgi:hypothetical protein
MSKLFSRGCAGLMMWQVGHKLRLVQSGSSAYLGLGCPRVTGRHSSTDQWNSCWKLCRIYVWSRMRTVRCEETVRGKGRYVFTVTYDPPPTPSSCHCVYKQLQDISCKCIASGSDIWFTSSCRTNACEQLAWCLTKWNSYQLMPVNVSREMSDRLLPSFVV